MSGVSCSVYSVNEHFAVPGVEYTGRLMNAKALQIIASK
jgi:hypothetical protein